MAIRADRARVGMIMMRSTMADVRLTARRVGQHR